MTAPETATPPHSGCQIRGARTHNLKAIDCRIPFGQLTAITGVSGSGKSTLAFDVLYAEGQRRFVDCLSTYARQFLPRLDRPEVDSIGEIQPPVALHQHTAIRNARSTVGSITELSDLLQLLFAHGGTPYCPSCEIPMHEETAASAAAALRELPEGRYVLVASIGGRGNRTPGAASAKKPPRPRRGRTPLALSPAAALPPPHDRGREWRELGYSRVYETGQVRDWPADDPTPEPLVVIDRFTPKTLTRVRAGESVEAAWRIDPASSVYRLGERAPCLTLRQGTSCPRCARRWDPLRPRHFSADSPLGACPSCQGFGRLVIVDRDKVVPDRKRSLREGAVVPFGTKTGAVARRRMLEQARIDDIPLDLPFGDLSPPQQDWVFDGQGRYRGVAGLFKKLERKRYRVHVRVFLARYRGYLPCPDCRASRLRPEALAMRVGAHNLADLQDLPVRDLTTELEGLALSPEKEERVRTVLVEMRERLGYLHDVGLGYLSLTRTARTLSGGETQRIRLASGLGTSLTRTLYILDEPTVGLHATDTARMLSILHRLRDAGNTVVVVEHDPGIIHGADHLIVLGPSGGEDGGEILFEGPAAEFFQREPDFFRVAASPHPGDAADPRESLPATGSITLEAIRHHNLDIEQLVIPTDRLVVITGVSGSGKSTLIDDVLYRNARRLAGVAVEEVGQVRRIAGMEAFSEVLLVSQNPLGRSSRSNVLTYTGLLGIVRKLLVQTPRAKQLRLKPGAFSFNVEGGRCEACKGMGTVTLEMHFLADVEVTCESCRGRRFREQVLEVTYRGRSILQLLDLTVTEAISFFGDRKDVHRLLDPVVKIGLGYLRLGQSTATLSGGEAQRLKIASLLADKSAWKMPGCFLLDEPTTGLHPRDIDRLLAALRDLVARGHAVIVVEHQLDFIRAADYVIDLGPGGGDEGGRLLFTGTPKSLEGLRGSATAAALGEANGITGTQHRQRTVPTRGQGPSIAASG